MNESLTSSWEIIVSKFLSESSSFHTPTISSCRNLDKTLKNILNKNKYCVAIYVLMDRIGFHIL